MNRLFRQGAGSNSRRWTCPPSLEAAMESLQPDGRNEGCPPDGDVRPAAAAHSGGCAPGPADSLEPAAQRDQVHADPVVGRRPRPARPRIACEDGREDTGQGIAPAFCRMCSIASVRPIVDDPRDLGPWPRSVDRQASRGAARRHDRGDEPGARAGRNVRGDGARGAACRWRRRRHRRRGRRRDADSNVTVRSGRNAV